MPSLLPVVRSSLVLAALASTVLLSPSEARSEVLYRLETTCSLGGASPQPCTVEAVDEGESTLYRHRIGAITETIRITQGPITMSRWIESSQSWQPLTTAAARFSTNTVCFNGRDLCVVNNNYLNSVREDGPDALRGRDLVKVHFDPDGRVNASCYDAGCEVTLK